MWEWSRAVAERGAATAWTRSAGESTPTVVDPDVRSEPGAEFGAELDEPAYDDMAIGDRLETGYGLVR
ncbi:hypothetical protein [Nocardia veterana]|uniref:Uncharacterized protein n=1 Tax=Nocardia veterana TaxID=132249 RepID=A0A7X6LXF6_9NOCA|nr:hypothetical protein [Nocardia veterana]NKY86424.1 hypothetical protein [Nocardia veterana]